MSAGFSAGDRVQDGRGRLGVVSDPEGCGQWDPEGNGQPCRWGEGCCTVIWDDPRPGEGSGVYVDAASLRRVE